MKKVIDFSEIKSILIACAVNTARSRMAEGFFRDIFNKNKVNINVKSCGVGTNARDGMLISLDAILVMKEQEIYLDETSTSKSLYKHPNLLEESDLIIAMTQKQKKSVKETSFVDNKTIITLKEFAGKVGDIEDPSMKGIEGFRKTRNEIRNCIKNGLKIYMPNLKL